jgi:hypothetical protein
VFFIPFPIVIAVSGKGGPCDLPLYVTFPIQDRSVKSKFCDNPELLPLPKAIGSG